MTCERSLGVAFEYLIVQKSHKSHGMKIETFEIRNIETMLSFYGWKKALIKTWNKILHCFPFETSTSKSKNETNDKKTGV